MLAFALRRTVAAQRQEPQMVDEIAVAHESPFGALDTMPFPFISAEEEEPDEDPTPQPSPGPSPKEQEPTPEPFPFEPPEVEV
jgi:hypothetical protein